MFILHYIQEPDQECVVFLEALEADWKEGWKQKGYELYNVVEVEDAGTCFTPRSNLALLPTQCCLRKAN